MASNRNNVVVLIAVIAVAVGLWHIYPVEYQSDDVRPVVVPVAQEVTERIGTTDFYLQYSIGTTTPTLVTMDEVTMSEGIPRWNYGLLDTPVKTFKENVFLAKAEGISIFFTEGLELAINDNGSVVTFGGALTYREYDEFKVLRKFTTGDVTGYLLMTQVIGTSNGYCGAGVEENLYLATVDPAGNHITAGYPYYSCMFGLSDGDVSYYLEGEHLLVSNNNSVMYMNFANPKWGSYNQR